MMERHDVDVECYKARQAEFRQLQTQIRWVAGCIGFVMLCLAVCGWRGCELRHHEDMKRIEAGQVFYGPGTWMYPPNVSK